MAKWWACKIVPGYSEYGEEDDHSYSLPSSFKSDLTKIFFPKSVMLTSIKKVSPGLRHSEEDNRSFVFISIIRIHSHPHSNQTQQKKSFFFSKKILCVRKFSTFFSLNASVLHSVYRRFTKKYQKNKHFCDRDHTHTHTHHTHTKI